MKKFRKGAASFYIVAISTLILVIIAASFIGVIISEVTRTSNDDLAQSAYDSALAGIEDAKLAYYSYQNCKNDINYTTNSGLSCAKLVDWVENGNVPDGVENSVESDELKECDMVSYILGRNNGNAGEVPVQEGEVSNNMQQAYTCVTMTNTTNDVLGSLSESNPEYTVRIKSDVAGAIKKVKKVRVKWHLVEDGEGREWSDYTIENGIKSVTFGADAPVPAVLSVGMIQTSEEFALNSFDVTQGAQTNRGIVYLVPTNKDDGVNNISKEGFLKSNDKVSKNDPYIIGCDSNDDYACSVDIDIPEPIGGNRSSETFIFKVALPYGRPSTSFSLEFFCGDDEVCASDSVSGDSGNRSQLTLKDVQIKVDSTGRANDLYRRVEMRLEAQDVAFPYPLYAIQALDEDHTSNHSSIIKNVFPTSEYNF